VAGVDVGVVDCVLFTPSIIIPCIIIISIIVFIPTTIAIPSIL
jgi:hypothetical protein